MNKMVEYGFRVLFSLMEGILYGLVLHRCISCGWKKRHKAAIMSLCAVVFMLVSEHLELPFPVKSLVVLTALILIAIPLYKAPYVMIIFVTVSVFYLNLVADLIVGNIMSGILEKSIIVVFSERPRMYVLSGLIVHFIQIVFAFLVVYFYEHVIFSNPKKYWILLDAILVLSYLLAALFLTVNPLIQEMYNPFLIVASVIAFVIINIMVVALFCQMSKHYMREKQMLLFESMSEKLSDDLGKLNESKEEFNKIRHEWGNHLSVLTLFLKQGQINEALMHLDSVGLSIPQYESVIYTNNESIDFILNAKVGVAKKKDIDVRISCGNIGPLDIPADDIISIIANLMDNATEAVEKLDAGRRVIKIDCRSVKDYLFFIVENPYGHKILTDEKGIVSSKPKQLAHGYGLSIVKTLCEKHWGRLDISYNSGIFISKAVLKI